MTDTTQPREQALHLIQELSRISMSLAADLVQGADYTFQGHDYLDRNSVMERVMKWRAEWDATAPARTALMEESRATPVAAPEAPTASWFDSGMDTGIVPAAATTASASDLTPADGDLIRMRCEVSKDGGATWLTVSTSRAPAPSRNAAYNRAKFSRSVSQVDFEAGWDAALTQQSAAQAPTLDAILDCYSPDDTVGDYQDKIREIYAALAATEKKEPRNG